MRVCPFIYERCFTTPEKTQTFGDSDVCLASRSVNVGLHRMCECRVFMCISRKWGLREFSTKTQTKRNGSKLDEQTRVETSVGRIVGW